MSNVILTSLITLITTLAASTGLWSYLQKRLDQKDLKTKVLIGLAHNEIVNLASSYIRREWIYDYEYRNLSVYLFEPYKEMGGNGFAAKLMDEVEELPIKISGKESSP